MFSWWRFNNTNKKSETQSLTSSNNLFINSDVLLSFEEFNPKKYEDVELIVNTLVLQKPVKLDLQDTVISDRRRIVDFLCGVAYVLNFEVKKVDVNVYEFKLNK